MSARESASHVAKSKPDVEGDYAGSLGPSIGPGSMQDKLSRTFPLSLVLLFLLAAIASDSACASTIAEVYNASFSVSVDIQGLTDGNGNVLNGIPSDLSIVGQANDQNGSGFFSSTFGPNKPPATTESSVRGAGQVTVGGFPSGHGPLALGINDGFTLNGNASGSISRPLVLGGGDLVSSDISQSGDIFFINSSVSTTYFAKILVTWSFDITAETNGLPGEGVNVDAGYVFDVARRTEGIGGTDLFSEDGFITVVDTDVQRRVGSNEFTAMFEIAPDEAPIFTARSFVGGIGGTNAALSPEPSGLSLCGLGGLVVAYCVLQGRRRRPRREVVLITTSSQK